MEQKLGSERRDNRTLLGTLYLHMFYVMGALQLITWVLTAARRSPTTVYIKILLRDAGLENVRDLESCMREIRDRASWSQFSSRRLLGVEQKKEVTILSNELCEEMVPSTQNNICRKYDAKIFIIIYILRYTH